MCKVLKIYGKNTKWSHDIARKQLFWQREKKIKRAQMFAMPTVTKFIYACVLATSRDVEGTTTAQGLSPRGSWSDKIYYTILWF